MSMCKHEVYESIQDMVDYDGTMRKVWNIIVDYEAAIGVTPPTPKERIAVPDSVSCFTADYQYEGVDASKTLQDIVTQFLLDEELCKDCCDWSVSESDEELSAKYTADSYLLEARWFFAADDDLEDASREYDDDVVYQKSA